MGLRQQSGTADHNAYSTASRALGALLLAKTGVHREQNLRWATISLDWLYTHLKDSDDLYFDGFRSPNWDVSKTKWTYNTRAPIRAFVEHYLLTKNQTSLERAKTQAKAATDRNKSFYDSERSKESQYAKLPVGERPTVKPLLVNGGDVPDVLATIRPLKRDRRGETGGRRRETRGLALSPLSPLSFQVN